MNKKLEVSGQGVYKPVVKLVRQIRKHHFAEGQKPGGLYFELLTYWAFASGVSGESVAEILAETLKRIAAQLVSSPPLTDPVLHSPYRPEPDATALAAAAHVFGVIASRLRKPCVRIAARRLPRGAGSSARTTAAIVSRSRPAATQTAIRFLRSHRLVLLAREGRVDSPSPIATLDPAGLEAFQTELIRRGFEPLDPDRARWVGPLSESLTSLTDVRTMTLRFLDGFLSSTLD